MSALLSSPTAPRTSLGATLAPHRLVATFIAAHVVVWTLAPSLLHWGLPLDLVEGYAIGHEWVIGYHKHPAAPWWLLEASRALSGAVGWPAYLVSAATIGLTYWLVFLLGRELLDARRAAMGTLLLAGVIYFSWVVPEFNHNVAQMPLWMGFLLALWRARHTGATMWWLACGLLAGLTLYAKLASLVLPALAIAFAASDDKLRAAARTAGPWLAVAVFFVTAMPILYWLVTTDLVAFEYAAQRSRGRAAGGTLVFLAKQIASAAGLYALIVLALARRKEPSPGRISAWAEVPKPERRFLLWFLLAPPLALAALALATGVGLKGAWGTPMLSLAGLAAVAWLGSRLDATALRRIVIGAFALLIAVPTAYGAALQKPSEKLLTPKRTNWPQAEVAAEVQRIWRQTTNAPLRIVAGDLWAAGMIAAHAADRPSVLVDGSLRYSSWIDRQRIEREGFMAVWWRAAQDPPTDLRAWIGERIDGQLVFRMRGSDRGQTAIVLYTIVKPGELKADAPLRPAN